MCGIDGILSKNKIDESVLKKMNYCMIHRGPHSDGFFYDDNIGLAMRRLKIIDLETGDQPIFNEKNNVIVIFNGEIYNFESLREELEKKGHQFKSKTDTEVLVHGYEEWGIDELLSRLNGMFAFCIYDKKEKKVYLTRDRLGEKPLYYYFQNGNFIFGSELQALLESNEIPIKISKLALYSYLAVHYVPGDMCIIQDVKKLLPGHYLEFDVENFCVKLIEYWDLKEGKFEERTYEEYVKNLKKLLEDSVKRRMISDVPIGVFLSGGIDSSVIVNIMKKFSAKVNTFSIGFEDPEFDESKYANIIVQKYDTNHHHFILKVDKVRELLAKIVRYMDEPSGDQALLPVYWLSHEAKKYVTVVLGGEGGDEMFAGYSYYPTQELLHIDEYQNDKNELLSNFLNANKSETLSGFPILTNVHDRMCLIKNFDQNDLIEEKKKYVWLEKFNEKIDNISDHLRKCQYTDVKTWLPDDLLMKFDKMSMSISLEGRAPFLDYRVAEFAFNLPSRYKITTEKSKIILRDAFSSELPKEIFLRKKQGFNLPMSDWIRTHLRDLIEQMSDTNNDDGIDNEYLKGIIGEHLSGKGERGRLLYAILVYKLWVKSLFERYGNMKHNST